MKIQRRPLLLLCLSIALLLQLSCKKSTPEISCEGMLFGIPIAATGLDSTQCRAVCECKGFTSKTFTQNQYDALKSWVLTQPYAELTSNPYDAPVPQRDPGVCAMIVDDLAAREYHMETFESEDAATAAGAILSHHDACGLCSTLQDFEVYARDRDIGMAVRLCGLSNFSTPIEDLIICIEDLGFTKPCAQVWAYNVRNTQAYCLEACLSSTSYNLSDGSLSPCFECDEMNSGPIFKAVAGRTRRNTGLASTICRFCEEVQPVGHEYPE